MTGRNPPTGAAKPRTSKAKGKPAPPQPLVEYTKPSTRHPLGLPRCQRWKIRDGALWQCPQPARVGVPVCRMHGAGSAKREANGERVPPALANAVDANKAPRAVAILLAQHPEFRALYEHHLSAPLTELLDFRPYLAAAKALVDAYVQKSKLEGDYGPFGSASSIERALGAVAAFMKIGERYLGIEAKLGPMTQLELAWIRYATVQTMVAFVVPERLEEARAFFRRKLVEARELGIGKEES